MDEVGFEKALGSRLQSARKLAGLTQEELCRKSGLSYSTLAKIERGAIKAPSIFTIQNIAIVLGLSLDELIGLPAKRDTLKQKSKSGISFIYFDVNGCLVRFFHRAFTSIAEDTGAQPDIIETAFWHYNDAVCRGEISMAEFNLSFAKKLGVPKINWETYYLEAVEPIKEMHKFLSWVSENYNFGLLTNIMPGLIDAMVKQNKIPNLSYKVIVDSSDIGVIKPEPKIYEIAQGLAEVAPGEILLVDDSRSNLMAAEKAGWHVLWFDDYRPDESTLKIQKALEF